MASSWSVRICLESNKSRPIRVLLPSSTEPVMTSRSSALACVWSASAAVDCRATLELMSPTVA